jgi:NAD(P)-dependent dehydrogenase (short-subunit alcohol dehydrogenase family)
VNDSKTVLITGATGRLGADLVGRFAVSGWRVIFHYRTARDVAFTQQRALRLKGYDVHAVGGIFDEDSAVAEFAERVIKEHGCPDLTINNASSFQYDFPGHIDRDILRQSIDVHVIAPAILIDAFANEGRRSGKKIDIINIIDQKVNNINPDYYSYTIGKIGLAGITKIWQSAHIEGVRVFGVYPGLMSVSGDQTLGRFDDDARKSLLGRAVKSDDIYDGIIYLVNSKSLYGSDLTIDAGESIVPRARDVAFE